MADQVDAVALVEAVADFLRSIEGDLAGQKGFHAKVAANALAIVARELAQQPGAVEASVLGEYLGHRAGLPALRAELCGRLRAGQLTPETPGLLEALITATMAKVAVDNPRYSTLGRMGPL
jgi:Domain of unknown function (DUF6285)